MKKALINSMAANVIILAYLGNKRWYYKGGNKWIHRYDYATNPQYSEQVNISAAYSSPCQVALIGDSHVYKCHWGELLGFPVCNRGVGSDITKGAYSRVGTVIASRPKVCFILSGANDIEKGIRVENILQWYKKIIDTLTASGIRPVIMLSTPVSVDYPGSKDRNKRMAELNSQLKDLGECIGIEIAPGDLQKDGLHLTAAGYLKWREAILAFLLKQKLKQTGAE
jgi:hypothetical protein